MSRGGTSKQNTTFNQSQQVGQTAQNNASSLDATLRPMFTSMATDPTHDPVYQAENTAAQQSTGGATAAVKGQAGLQRLRTGNRGTSQTLMDESTRNAMRANSQNSLRAVADTSQAGVEGLQKLYGSNVSELLGSMGISSNIANNQASQPGWFQNMTSLINAMKGGGYTSSSGSSFTV